MSKTRESFTTPVGRLVQGDCFEAQTKDQQGNLRVVKTGPNAGQPAPVYFIGVAFAKLVPNPQTGVLEQNHEFNAFYALLDRVARTEWPALFPNGGACVNPKFAMKLVDGDGVDQNGKSNADKEGHAGHWIIRFSSAYAPKTVRPAGGNVWETITDKTAIKRGYYVRVAGGVTGNDNAQNPGLYVNLDMVELAGYGPEIVSGPDAASAFGAPAALPPGATAAPTLPAGLPSPGAPAAAGAPAVPGAPAAGAPAVPGYTGYMGVPGATPGAPAAPLGGPAPNAASPSLPVAPTPPSAPGATISPSRAMTAAAGGLTYESFIAGGWTDEQLIANGYMTA